MKIGKSSPPSGGSGGNLPHAIVSAADYIELAKAAVRARGNEGFVVKRNPSDARWRAWMAYFDQLKILRVARTLEKITTPTEWPYEFDLSAARVPSEQPRGRAPTGSAEHQRVIEGFKRLRAMLAAKPPEPDVRKAQTPGERAAAEAYHADKLEKLRALSSTPLTESIVDKVRAPPPQPASPRDLHGPGARLQSYFDEFANEPDRWQKLGDIVGNDNSEAKGWP